MNIDNNSHNAEKVKRAQMAVEARRGAVGCGHTGDAVKRARRAVYAQKNGILSGKGRHTHNAEVLGGAARAGRSVRSGRESTLRGVFKRCTTRSDGVRYK